MRRFLVGIQFNGRNYSGWQRQKNAKTVQGEVEGALNKLFLTDIAVQGCSRTDSGVSAEEYFFHFDADTKLPEGRVCFKLNRFLPNDIQAFLSKEVSSTFNALSDVKNKTYVYSLYVSEHKLPLYNRDRLQIEDKLDVERMDREAQVLVGRHDFSSFRTVGYEDGSKDKSCVRKINFISVTQNGARVDIKINGDGFLYNMVRIISGTLVDVGRGKISSLSEVLNAKDRSKAGETLSPKGLKLLKVNYGEEI